MITLYKVLVKKKNIKKPMTFYFLDESDAERLLEHFEGCIEYYKTTELFISSFNDAYETIILNS